MKFKAIFAFFVAVGISLLAAGYRFGDSGHAIGLLSAKGGRAPHGFHLANDAEMYTLIVTGTVIPPLRDDARIVLEGKPAMTYAIYDNPPIVDLGLHRKPQLIGNQLTGLQPRDRFALWVVMQPQDEEPLVAPESPDDPLLDCCRPPEMPLAFGELRSSQPGSEQLQLAFYSATNNRPLLKIPLNFHDASGGDHE